MRQIPIWFCFFGLISLLAHWFVVPVAPTQSTLLEQELNLESDLVSINIAVGLPPEYGRIILRPEDFIVYEDGRRQMVTSKFFWPIDAPIDIVLLIDNSGSMGSHIQLVKSVAQQFVNWKRPQDRIAILTCNGQLELLSGFSLDTPQLYRAIKHIDWGSGTKFYDALFLTAKQILAHSDSRRALVILSDGIDSESEIDFQRVKRALGNVQVLIYIIQVDSRNYLRLGLEKNILILSAKQRKMYDAAGVNDLVDFLHQSAENELKQIISASGGELFPLKDFSELAETYRQILLRLGTVYSIGFVPFAPRDGRQHNLTVKIAIPKSIVHSPSGFWASTNDQPLTEKSR